MVNEREFPLRLHMSLAKHSKIVLNSCEVAPMADREFTFKR